jgi:hypothetical protein
MSDYTIKTFAERDLIIYVEPNVWMHHPIP